MSQKSVQWVGSSREDLSDFPKDARVEAGHQIYQVEKGLDPDDWKPLPTVGAGAREIRISGEQEHRVIYVASLGEAVYVLHAFEKKTQKTRRADLDLARRRYRLVLQNIQRSK